MSDLNGSPPSISCALSSVHCKICQKGLIIITIAYFRVGCRIGFSETYHGTHVCTETHNLQGGPARGCILFTNCYGSRRREKIKKNSSVCITSEHVRVKMSKIAHVPHNWANVVKKKKDIPPEFSHCLSPMLSPQLTFPPLFIQEGFFP